METIVIEEFVNGFGVKGYKSNCFGYFLNEIAEERLDILRRIERWASDEIIKELEGKQSHASVM